MTVVLLEGPQTKRVRCSECTSLLKVDVKDVAHACSFERARHDYEAERISNSFPQRFECLYCHAVQILPEPFAWRVFVAACKWAWAERNGHGRHVIARED